MYYIICPVFPGIDKKDKELSTFAGQHPFVVSILYRACSFWTGHRTHGLVLLSLPSASATEDLRTVHASLHQVEQLPTAASKQFLHLSVMVAG